MRNAAQRGNGVLEEMQPIVQQEAVTSSSPPYVIQPPPPPPPSPKHRRWSFHLLLSPSTPVWQNRDDRAKRERGLKSIDPGPMGMPIQASLFLLSPPFTTPAAFTSFLFNNEMLNSGQITSPEKNHWNHQSLGKLFRKICRLFRELYLGGKNLLNFVIFYHVMLGWT